MGGGHGAAAGAASSGNRPWGGSSTHPSGGAATARTRPSGQGSGTVNHPAGAASASGNWQSAFSGSHATDAGLAHYSSANVSSASAHSTHYWSGSYQSAHASAVRSNFSYSNAFRPNWNTQHPGAWYAAGWQGATAWHGATWPALAGFCLGGAASSGGGSSEPEDYDYGNTVVYNDNSVYVNGQDVGTAQQYNQQAVTLADQGQKASAPPEEKWQAVGVFALVQGDEKTSNNIFQIAVDQNGVMRGNYYDGLMDTTTPIYGSVDKKSLRAAWTIGKKKDRVFEAGFYNLTKSETPVLIHIGTDRTQQMLLVRVEQPKKDSDQ